jgi:hypothetical protein
MARIIRVGFLVCVGLLVNTTLNAQDSLIYQLDLSQELESWYDSLTAKDNPILIQGNLAEIEPKASRSHPYFGKNQWYSGEVTYRNQLFKSVVLLYNIEKDELLIQRNGINSYEMFVELKKDMVSSFAILDSRFVKINNNPLDKPGFYQVLFEGANLSLYAKRVKKLDINGDDAFQFVQSDDYYILFNNEFFAIRSAGGVARIFKSNRKQIKSFAYQSGIRKLTSETDKQFVKLIEYCNTLNL